MHTTKETGMNTPTIGAHLLLAS